MLQILRDFILKHPNVQFTGLTGKDIHRKQSEEMRLVNTLLEKLSQIRPRAARVVELRFFGGLTVPRVAEILNIGTKTVERDTEFARAWLFREMTRNDQPTNHG